MENNLTKPLSKRIDAELLKDFRTPFQSFRVFREAVGYRLRYTLDFDDGTDLFWIYWTPGGDEMMVGRIIPKLEDENHVFTTGGYGEFDGEWPVWLKLRQMNPNVFDVPGRAEVLGSSEEEGSHVLLVEKDDPFKVYLASKAKLYSELL